MPVNQNDRVSRTRWIPLARLVCLSNGLNGQNAAQHQLDPDFPPNNSWPMRGSLLAETPGFVPSTIKRGGKYRTAEEPSLSLHPHIVLHRGVRARLNVEPERP